MVEIASTSFWLNCIFEQSRFYKTVIIFLFSTRYSEIYLDKYHVWNASDTEISRSIEKSLLEIISRTKDSRVFPHFEGGHHASSIHP